MTALTGTPNEWSSLLSKNGNPLNQIILYQQNPKRQYLSAMPAFPNQFPTILVTPTTIIVGRIYRTPPVNSNMITTTLTVMCIIPPNDAAAPRKAYVPGVIHVTPSAGQAAKKALSGYAECNARTRSPINRPKEAPTAIDGTKIPAGTFDPYETIINIVRITVANNNDIIFLHRYADLPLTYRKCGGYWQIPL
jgi:hypothetical protein